MKIRHLEYFIALADTGTYRRAATKLGITQSALSQSIAKLEASLQVQLLVRDLQGATLTDSGRLFLARARGIVAESRSLELELQGAKGEARPRINVGVGKSVMETFLPHAIDQFVRRNSSAVLHLAEGWSPDLYARLMEGTLDIVISCPLPDVVAPPELRREFLCNHREAVLVGKTNPLFSKPEVSLADLAQQYWILPPDGNKRLHYIRHVFEGAGVPPPEHIIRSDSTVLGPQLIGRGFVAHGLLEVVAAYLEPSAYRVLDISPLNFTRPVYLTTRGRKRLQPAAVDFCRDVRAASADLPPLPALMVGRKYPALKKTVRNLVQQI